MATDAEPTIDTTGLDFGDSAFVDPATATSGSGDGSGDNAGDADEYVRDAAGNIKRNKDGSPRKRRGRKPGSGNSAASGSSAQSKAKAKLSVSGIESLLIGIHLSLAAGLRTPEIALEADESAPLAKAIAEVAQYYPMPDMTEKAIAWGALIMIVGKTYIPKYMLAQQRIQQTKVAKKQDNVVNFGVGAFPQ